MKDTIKKTDGNQSEPSKSSNQTCCCTPVHAALLCTGALPDAHTRLDLFPRLCFAAHANHAFAWLCLALPANARKHTSTPC